MASAGTCISPDVCFRAAHDTTTYCVVARWGVHYPSQLKAGLKAAGYTLVDPKQRCGYSLVKSVTADAVQRGKIYASRLDSSVPREKLSVSLQKSRAAIRVLESEFPWAEFLIMLASLLAFLLLMWAAWWFADTHVQFWFAKGGKFTGRAGVGKARAVYEDVEAKGEGEAEEAGQGHGEMVEIPLDGATAVQK